MYLLHTFCIHFYSHLIDLFADGSDFSEETINKNRNLYYQRQTVSQILDFKFLQIYFKAEMIYKQFEQTISMITNALNLHLNIEQSFLINTSSIIIFLKKMIIDTLSNQTIYLNDKSQVFLPDDLYFNLTTDSTIVLRVRHLFNIYIFR